MVNYGGIIWTSACLLLAYCAFEIAWVKLDLHLAYPHFKWDHIKGCGLSQDIESPDCVLLLSDFGQESDLGFRRDHAKDSMDAGDQKILRNYLYKEQDLKVNEDCQIGVGYNSCVDINFQATNLFKVMQPMILQMEKGDGQELVPQVHEKIDTLRRFVETFLYGFINGANAERVSASRDLFYLFYETLAEHDVEFREEIGGHSPVWAKRAQMEECKVFIATQNALPVIKQLKVKGFEQHLQWPSHEILELDQDAREDQWKTDLHLVFEYAEGDTVLDGRFRAPRSNRFYFVHDPNGGKLSQLEIYHTLVKKYPVQRHMFGGYQLLQRLNHTDAEQKFIQQAQLWKDMRSDGKDHRIHVEFADFTDRKFFRLFEKHVVQNANSLGMNEQELKMIIDYWADPKNLDLRSAAESKPSFNEILDQLRTFFKTEKKLGLDINRVHLHPYGSFFMCYDKNKWHDAKDAIIKSSMAIPKYCIKDSAKFIDIDKHIDNFELGDTSQVDQIEGIDIKKDPENELTYSFDLDEDIHCYLQFFVKCKKVYKTAGMGDTISSVGFMYHVPK